MNTTGDVIGRSFFFLPIFRLHVTVYHCCCKTHKVAIWMSTSTKLKSFTHQVIQLHPHTSLSLETKSRGLLVSLHVQFYRITDNSVTDHHSYSLTSYIELSVSFTIDIQLYKQKNCLFVSTFVLRQQN